MDDIFPLDLYQLLIPLLVLLLMLFIVFRVRKFFRRLSLAKNPRLGFGQINVLQPDSLTRKGLVNLPLANFGGGKAVIDQVKLRVEAHGAVTKPGRIRKAKSLPEGKYKAVLRSDRNLYRLNLDARSKLVLMKGKGYGFSITLSSDEHHWYRMLLEVVWYSKRSPNKKHVLRSSQFYMEFPIV